MKYTTEVLIHCPVETVVRLFQDPALLPQWMEGLQRWEPISGTSGQKGAVAHLTFKMKNREMRMTETILESNLPDLFTARYEAGAVVNIVHNRFEKVDATTTRYITDNEFELGGFMKLMGWFMPGAFKKQSLAYQHAFKKMVENQHP